MASFTIYVQNGDMADEAGDKDSQRDTDGEGIAEVRSQSEINGEKVAEECRELHLW